MFVNLISDSVQVGRICPFRTLANVRYFKFYDAIIKSIFTKSSGSEHMAFGGYFLVTLMIIIHHQTSTSEHAYGLGYLTIKKF